MMHCDQVFAEGNAFKRHALLTKHIDILHDCGVEIGALTNPVVKPGQGNISFVDYTTTEELRSYPHEATVKKDEIVDVKYVWAGSGSLAAVVGQHECFDYAIASHVIEHVPNVLGWFKGITEVLKNRGIFNLAIPDRRFTFDVGRKDSTLGEAVEAYLLNYQIPSIRQEFDHCHGALAVSPGSVWGESDSGQSYPKYSGNIALQLAYDQAKEIVSKGRYYDSHCWVFTPLSFIELMQGATQLGLFPDLVVESFTPTAVGDFEFFVSFRKVVDPASADALRNHQMHALQQALDAVRRQQAQAQRLASR